MKFIITLLFLTSFTCQAQFGNIKRNQIDALKQDTLVIVLRSDSAFNANFTYAVKNNWTLSPIKFVQQEDLRNLYSNNQEVFMLGHFNGMFYLTPEGADNVEFIGLLTQMNFSTSVSLENRERIGPHLYFNPNNSGRGILCAYIRSIEAYIRKVDSKIVGSQTAYIKHIRSMEKEASGKEILVDFDNDFHLKQEDIKSKNKAQVKSSSKDDINSAIIAKKDALFFVPISAGGRYFLYLFSCKDGNLYYFSHVRDWNKLPEVAGGKMLKAIQ